MAFVRLRKVLPLDDIVPSEQELKAAASGCLQFLSAEFNCAECKRWQVLHECDDSITHPSPRVRYLGLLGACQLEDVGSFNIPAQTLSSRIVFARLGITREGIGDVRGATWTIHREVHLHSAWCETSPGSWPHVLGGVEALAVLHRRRWCARDLHLEPFLPFPRRGRQQVNAEWLEDSHDAQAQRCI